MSAEPVAALWVKSNFSFLQGASHPEELIQTAADLGLAALALTDEMGFYGQVRAAVAARALDLRLQIGASVRLSSGQRAVIWVRQRNGYAQLCRLISRVRQRAPKGAPLLSRSDLLSLRAEGLSLGCVDGAAWDEGLLRALAERWPRDDLFFLLSDHRRPEEVQQQLALQALCKKHPSYRLLAANEVLYHHRQRRPLQDLLTCVRLGCTLSDLKGRQPPNDEHALMDPAQFRTRFQAWPQAIEAGLELTGRCAFSLFDLRYVYPSEALPDGLSTQDWLRQLAQEGAQARYHGRIPEAVMIQLDRELRIIEDLDYAGYFLTMWEIVRFCQEAGILCQGRGSAANSILCYCLGITAIDPVRMDLLFERFLSRERAEPPDIDLDIEHERREEVIQWVYDRYGRRHAAMVAVIIRYRPKSAVKDIGKAIGIDQNILHRLSRMLSRSQKEIGADLFEKAGLDPQSSACRVLGEKAQELLDFPRHLSTHPGGFLLGHEPVDELVPVEPGGMANRTVIQWDKNDVESLGLFKVDLLGLGMLTQLQKSFRLIARHEGKAYDLATIPAEDPATYAMLSRGDSVGVFQVESRAQMAMLPRLRPRTFYDLTVEIALVRPGPISGDMVHPYLRRRSGEEEVVYPHPSLEPILKRTLGVPIFQEQVMKLAVVAAGYSPGEADQLRRDMAAWRSKGRIEHHRKRLIGGMLDRGIQPEFAQRVFEQIQGFGEYGFPESHAASFALISYASAWLKCHYPAFFYAALFNAQPMGFYSVSSLLESARREGIALGAICVQQSDWDCSLEPMEGRWRLRMGFRCIRGLSRKHRAALEAVERPATLSAFVGQSQLPMQVLQQLARADAFSSYGLDRRQALWVLGALVEAREGALAMMPQENEVSFRALSPLEELAWDQDSAQHSVRCHPMALLRPHWQGLGFVPSGQLRLGQDGERKQACGLVICRQKPQGKVTFITLEDEEGFVNVVVWPDVAARYTLLVKSAQILAVKGRLQVASGVVHLIAHRLWEPEVNGPVAQGRSRDFH
ncbi:MAG: error-prone DNA polymerase [Myxococcales bacterium]|nr:error-prone DNA polymerase [Myxococcales bacterium]